MREGGTEAGPKQRPGCPTEEGRDEQACLGNLGLVSVRGVGAASLGNELILS